MLFMGYFFKFLASLVSSVFVTAWQCLKKFFMGKIIFDLDKGTNFFFFSNYFWDFLLSLLSSFFSHSGDYFVSGWFPHCFGPW